MRKVMLAGAVLALVAAEGADAQQRVVMHGPAPQIGGGYARPGFAPRPGYQGRWGSKVGGHWWGGVNAPGGWNAYRRPVRGWTLPRYWVAPRFYVSDWSTYGLVQPPQGYTWVRYYDDAVLVDGRGSVYDSVSDVDWDQYDDGAYADDHGVYADSRDAYYQRRDSGVGGAVAGAVVGGVAGNVIAGRGNRLGGTLIGAGVGAAAGYAIDRAGDRRRDGYGADYGRPGRVPVAPDYPPPPPADYAPPPPPPPVYAPPAPVVQPLPAPGWRSADGRTTVTTTSGAGYASGGYYYPGATTTTVVVQTQPVVTTTTTEIYEDAVTYTRRAPLRTKTKRVWRPAPKCYCR